ncbi:ABC transporter permease [Gordonia soli]|uniref:Putative ABC transporter permease protein n=1 Tax=Gordonia soli NBRC 108243 TaxID=1223545 RepID=M0QDQ6_9ACTN|nr:ABC transporter permease subunit [Gordonia soli]GAC66733.1 putative ABC transporter permease protein [Gordonia soli NBRC 108243]
MTTEVATTGPPTEVLPNPTAGRGEQQVVAVLEQLRVRPTTRVALVVSAIVGWAGLAVLSGGVADTADFAVEGTVAVTVAAAVVAVVIVLSWSIAAIGRPAALSHWVAGALNRRAPWLVASAVWLLIWEWTTAKTGALVPPYFAAPQQILAEAWKDRGLLLSSLGNSTLLLVLGFAAGVFAGLITGVLTGWSAQANYWVHPILQYIGPVPALAWVPIIFVTFPTAYAGAVFLIALGVWFPVTLLTRAGVNGTPRSYYDVAQTLGGNTRFLVFRISLPAAVPSIFTGLFMALGIAFVTLTVAENFGVNSGLGWYINWKKGWSAYPAMYAGILVMVLFCGTLMTALLRARAVALRWQKDLVRW